MACPAEALRCSSVSLKIAAMVSPIRMGCTSAPGGAKLVAGRTDGNVGVAGAEEARAMAEAETAEAAETKAGADGPAKTRDETDGAAEVRDETDGVAEARDETDGVAEARDETDEAAFGGNSTCPSVVLLRGGGCPGASPVQSGLSPPARVRSFLPDTTAPGSEGGWPFVLGFSWCGACEEKGRAPNATGDGGTVPKAAGTAGTEEVTAGAAHAEGGKTASI
jgi:hypothetical protein